MYTGGHGWGIFCFAGHIQRYLSGFHEIFIVLHRKSKLSSRIVKANFFLITNSKNVYSITLLWHWPIRNEYWHFMHISNYLVLTFDTRQILSNNNLVKAHLWANTITSQTTRFNLCLNRGAFVSINEKFSIFWLFL